MRQTHRFFFVIAFFFSCGLLRVACEENGANSDEQDLLLKSVITQNDATVRQIESSPLYVSFSWRNTLATGPTPGPNGKNYGGTLVIDGKSRYWKHGDSFHQDSDIQNKWPDLNEVHDASTIFVVNDRYCAQYYKGARELHLYHFEDRENPYPAVKSLLDYYPKPDILEFGTRFSVKYSLLEAFERETNGNPPRYCWTPVEFSRNGKSMYLVRGELLRDGGNRLSTETVLDPQCGFLISESRTYDKTGDAFWVVEAQFQEILDGVWFPKSATRTLTEREDTLTLEVNDVRLGDPKTETMFTLESIDIDRERAMMYEYSNRGSERTLKGFWDGQWVAFEHLPLERKEAIKKAQHTESSGSPHSQKPLFRESNP